MSQNTKNREHLSEAEIMLYADAMRTDNWNEVSKSLYEHISDCEDCYSQVISFYRLLKIMPIEKQHPHQVVINEDDVILNRLRSDATPSLRFENHIHTTPNNLPPNLTLYEPDPGKLHKGTIHFEFGQPVPQDIVLRIFNDAEKRVKTCKLRSGVVQEKVKLGPAQKCPSGLYYWQLECGDNSRVGKFFYQNVR